MSRRNSVNDLDADFVYAFKGGNMTDIVERLRQRSMCAHIAMDNGPADDVSAHLREAADEIERLRPFEKLWTEHCQEHVSPQEVEIGRLEHMQANLHGHIKRLVHMQANLHGHIKRLEDEKSELFKKIKHLQAEIDAVKYLNANLRRMRGNDGDT